MDETWKTWEGMDLAKIEDAYMLTAQEVQFDMITKETLMKIKNLMESHLPEYEIKCDEENNPPSAADSGNIMLEVSDPKMKKYIKIIF